MNELATLEDLSNRAGEEITDPVDMAMGEALLRKASNLARFYGEPGWDSLTVPPVVKDIVVEAAWRAYENPAGYQSERAEANNIVRSDQVLAGCTFTPDELDIVRQAGGGTVGLSYWSVPLSRGDALTERVIVGSGGVYASI